MPGGWHGTTDHQRVTAKRPCERPCSIIWLQQSSFCIQRDAVCNRHVLYRSAWKWRIRLRTTTLECPLLSMGAHSPFSSCIHSFQPRTFVHNRNAAQRRFPRCPHRKQASAVASAYPFGNEGDPSDVKTRLKQAAEARMEEIVARV
jgi:hypothetical protein